MALVVSDRAMRARLAARRGLWPRSSGGSPASTGWRAVDLDARGWRLPLHGDHPGKRL